MRRRSPGSTFSCSTRRICSIVPGPYGDAAGADWQDNWRRFAALGRVGADIAAGAIQGYVPQVVHAHDWQSAMAPAYMRYGRAAGTPSVVTVHNLAFQGQFPAGIFGELGLPAEAMAIDGVEYYGGVGFLKAGLQAASAITTVSPTYAREIATPEFGMGLDGLIRQRADDLHGIVNGIDVEMAIAGLAPGVGGLAASGVRLAVLGSGDSGLEGLLLAAAARHRGRVGVVVGYDEKLSHLMQGGCDAIVVPSRFEPCGLTQLYGLRYGCVPVVARTGGLADTVIDANEAALSAGVATGFQFAPDDAGALLHAVRRLADAYQNPVMWASIQRQGMKADLSWDRGAEKYAALYRSLLSRKAR